MAVYVDDCFCEGNGGRWTGGGHMQADSLDELHAMAGRLGLRKSWFQSKPNRPDRDHYDLMAGKRTKAIALGAIAETSQDGAERRRRMRG